MLGIGRNTEENYHRLYSQKSKYSHSPPHDLLPQGEKHVVLRGSLQPEEGSELGLLTRMV